MNSVTRNASVCQDGQVGENIRSKIVNRCRIDMPRMGKALDGALKQEQVLSEIGQLTFSKPKRVEGVYGPLVDLANEFWLLTLKKTVPAANNSLRWT